MRRTDTWISSWRNGLDLNARDPSAMRRMATSPPKPKLSDRRRHAWTAGRWRATSPKRTMGSRIVAAQARIRTIAAPDSRPFWLQRDQGAPETEQRVAGAHE